MLLGVGIWACALPAWPVDSAEKTLPVSEIAIKGNQQIAENVILAAFPFKKGAVYPLSQLRKSARYIEASGFFKEVIIEAKETAKGVFVTIIVVENPKIGAVVFRGNTVFKESDLLETIQSKPGYIYNTSDARKDIQTLNAKYQDNGYFLAKIYSVEAPQTDGSPLIFNIGEGTLDTIIVSGNTKTQPHVILREFQLKPGMVITSAVLKEDLRRVYNLNFFAKVSPEILPGEKTNTYTIMVDVEEKLTTSLNFGGGFGQTSGAFGYVDLNADNFMGTGRQIFLRSQFGKSSTYQFKYNDPWALGPYKSLGVKLWYTAGDLPFLNQANNGHVDFRNERRTGAEVTVGLPINYQWRTSHSVKAEHVTVINQDAYNIKSYKLGLSYDSRNVWFNPSSGAFYDFTVEKAFKLSETDLYFTKYDLSLNQYIPTFEKQVLALRTLFGYIDGPDALRQANELYYVGGANTVRGFSDLDPFANGTKRLVFNIEYRYLFSDSFQGLVFFDLGYASNSFSSLLKLGNYRSGKGVGIRLFTPLGPLRLDVGNNDVGQTFVHFNIGQVF